MTDDFDPTRLKPGDPVAYLAYGYGMWARSQVKVSKVDRVTRTQIAVADTDVRFDRFSGQARGKYGAQLIAVTDRRVAEERCRRWLAQLRYEVDRMLGNAQPTEAAAVLDGVAELVERARVAVASVTEGTPA